MLRFVVVRGVLMWGIGTGVAFCAFQMLQHHELGIADIARNLFLFMAGGIAWGAGMWRFRTRKQHK
jgi:hypothetical protein